ncbi:MAG: AbrB/MazE/SpoVT family DNA-binding domain-containing protein [Candidatus Thermoplasmatota archaeon]|nr:AbrB/MazE/SpoVT family DNA-binding domain-containing protein [Candidatus Thermoplasmatota archaeon]
MYTVSITSQGQISIPAKLRRELGLEKYKKAVITVEDKKAVITPVKDFLDYAGAFKTKRRVSSRKVRQAFGEYLAEKAVGAK